MDNELKNPCKECICLPTCIQKYKEFNNDRFIDFPAAILSESCDILEKQYDIYEKLNGHKYRNNKLDSWWKDNYGKQT